MRPLARGIDDACRVLNVDLPGHGRTAPPDRPVGVEDCAALVADLIRRETAPPVTLIGHSNGGRIALYMASDERFKKLISRLVLISPSGIKPRRKLKTRAKSWIARLLKAPFALLPGKLRTSGLEWLRDSAVWRMLGSSDYRALSGVMRETFVRTVNHHLDDRVRAVSVPTLIFRGDGDTAVSQREVEILETSIPDAGVVILKGAGHYGYIDDPATVRAATRHFLSLDQPVAI